MNKQKVMDILMRLSAVFPSFSYPSDDEVVDTYKENEWYNWLQDYSEEVVNSAVNIAISKAGRFAPSISEIIQEIHALRSDRDSAEESWAKILKLVRSHSTKWEDDKILKQMNELEKRAIEPMGGLHNIGKITDDKLPFAAKRYKEIYEGLAERQDKIERLPKKMRASLPKFKDKRAMIEESSGYDGDNKKLS